MRQCGRKCLTGESHRSSISEELPDESVTAAQISLEPATLSDESAEEKEKTVQNIKRKLDNMGKELKELKKKVSRIFADLIAEETSVKVWPTNSNF